MCIFITSKENILFSFRVLSYPFLVLETAQEMHTLCSYLLPQDTSGMLGKACWEVMSHTVLRLFFFK